MNNLIIAHRGIHDNNDIPENSILAFKEAIKRNIAIELDLQLTKDNVLIVFHDDNLKRMTNKDILVKDISYNELKKLKLLNTKETIPTFNEALKIINGKVLIDIEIKNTKLIKTISKKVMNELYNYNYPYFIKSFNPKIIRYFYKHYPNIKRGLLIKDNFYNTILGKLILLYCKPNFLAISKKIINKYKNNKYDLFIWTIKDKNEMNNFKNITNNYICNIK